jgi:membrane protein
MSALSTVKGVVLRTSYDWVRHDAPNLAASLAYYAVFSIAPLLLIAIGVAGFVFGRQAAQGELMAQLQDFVGPDNARTVGHLLQNAARPGSRVAASAAGVLILLVGASGVMGQLQASLNRIWEVPPRQESGIKGLLRRRLLSFTMVLGVGFLLLVSLLVNAAVAALGTYMSGRLPLAEAALEELNAATSFAVITFLFALIFRYVPDVYVAWRDVWLGAAVTSALFTVGKHAIGLYLGRSTFASTYGAAASLVVLLVWVYYSAQILFFGAELTHAVATERRARDAPGSEAGPERERRRGRGRRIGDIRPAVDVR